MAEKGEEREHPKPSLWKTLTSTEGAQRQNNNNRGNQSDKRGQSLNDEAKRKSDGWGMSSCQKESDPLSWNRSRRMSSSHRSSTRHGGDLRQLLNRVINWIEESLSPPHCIQDSFYYECFCKFHLRYFRRYREPYCDLRRVSWSNGKEQAATNPRRLTLCSGREGFRLDWYDANQKESDGWGQNYSPIKKSQSRSLTHSSQAAVGTNNNNKETDSWGTALDQTCADAWNQPSSNLSPYLGLKYPYYYSPLVSTSCSGGTDADMQPISSPYAIVGTQLPRLSVVNPVDPTPEVPNLGQSQPNQNLVEAIGTAAVETIDAVDNHSFRRALIGFAKPKLKPFWLKQLLNDANYLEILDKFVNNVTRSLGTCAPKTCEDSCKFVKKENDSLSKCLQMYLGRFVTEDVMMNILKTFQR